MTSKKYLFVLSSIVFLSYSADFTCAEEGDIIAKGGTIFSPLASHQPTLSVELQEQVSPVGVWHKFQNNSDAAGGFKLAGPTSLAALTTIDDFSGYPSTRTVGTTPLLKEDSFSLHTNPDSLKMKHINATNKVSLYQVWHTPEQSRQITLSGSISHVSTSDAIDISIPFEGNYHSNWNKYHFKPNEATVTQLRHYHSNGRGYCHVEGISYKKQSNGKWLITKKPSYVARNSYQFSPEELASAKKKG